jgi:polyferredoxin
MYRETDDGLIENVYTLRVVNKDSQPHTYTVSISGVPDAQLHMDRPTVVAGASEVISLTVRVDAPALPAGGPHPIDFIVTSTDQSALQTRSTSRFFSPM